MRSLAKLLEIVNNPHMNTAAAPLTTEQLEELREFDSPTISNAIERLGGRPWTSGFMDPEIRHILGGQRPIVGYAVTGRIQSTLRPTAEDKARVFDWYEAVSAGLRPSIAVLEDLDPSPVGSFWGEVQATTHRALGCVATITNGGVRDLVEVEEIGFGYWARQVLVSHAYCHMRSVGGSVRVGGLDVRPGDLLHADRHGVVQIPYELAPDLADACRAVQRAELHLLEPLREYVKKGKEVDVAEIRRLREEMARRREGK